MHLSLSTWQQPLPPSASLERSKLVERTALSILSLSARRLRVSIDGLTAAGKTSFGHELADCISRAGRPTYRASLDDFKKPWRDRHLYDRESGEGYFRNAFDYPAVIQLLLEPFRPSGSGQCALCSIDPLTQVDHSSSVEHVAENGVLIVDGVFAFRPEINDHWDYRIWLEIDADTSIRRGAARDYNWAGSAAESVHRDRYLPAERIYVAEVNPVRQADLIIDNSTFDRPRVLRGWHRTRA